jgi:hypothetical protein
MRKIDMLSIVVIPLGFLPSGNKATKVDRVMG